ncbi:MAG: ATP-binding cassette domain-containing protein, partial [Bacteroidota bacterium]
PTQRFWRLLKPDRDEIRNMYVYAVFAGLVSLSLPLGIQAIINFIQGGQLNTAWVVLVAIVVAGVAIQGALQIFQLRITEDLQQKIFTRAAFEFAYRIPRIRLEVLYKHYAPELMNRFFDIISVQKSLSKILLDFSAAGLQTIFGLILLSFYHPFFIAFSVLMVLLIIGIFRWSGQRGLATSLKESKYKYKVAHWLEELARTSNTFKLAGRTNLHLEKMDDQVENYLTARENHFGILIQQYYLMVGFKVVVALGLLALGGILVMEQQMNIGQFVAAEIIILSIMSSVEKLVFSLETIYDILTSLEKIGQVTDLELEQDEGMDMVRECMTCGVYVELDNVTFGYPGQQTPTLRDLSFKALSGEKWVVTGENKSGKSTLLYILGGMYDVQHGSISYNGLSKGSLDLVSLRSIIGDSLTQEQLFEGTVLENITIGREAATFDNVKWAIQNLGLTDFIKRLPQGYHTVLDPQGKKLPRSIVQKLLLARSIADKPKLLLLEDALEHMDEQDRIRIVDFLTARENEWTLVAVSSDPYFASKSDQVAIMKDGRIIQSGPFVHIQPNHLNQYAQYFAKQNQR